jgi:hypothetical protein
MPSNQLTLRDLRQQLDDISERFPALKPDDLFVAWFLRAYITDNEKDAVAALAGDSGDQGVDALIIDDTAHAVFLVQGKFRQTLHNKNESRADVMSFAQLAPTLANENETEFLALQENADENVADRLKQARQRIRRQGYKLWLYYVTLGKCSSRLHQQANQTVRSAECSAAIEVFDGKKLMTVLRDYLDGVAPPIPTLDLEMEKGDGVDVKGVLQRYDNDNDVDCWVFTMRGDSIARIFDHSGLRLFARNIRGFLGESTSVNRGMSATLRDEPDHFFYYNNGITILCDRAERLTSKGSDFLRVNNPQVINGQQTSRVLSAHPKEAAKASVLVKVMQVPRDAEAEGDGFDDLLSKIVAGTNWQNAISPSDLMSNDRTQIELERTLRKLGYLYLRKRQTKGDAKRIMGGKGYIAIKKTEMAQAVAGCDLDPSIVREGKENLFEEEMYSTIFPNADPNYFLPRYWLMRDVTYWSAGARQRGYAKWLVLGFVWTQLAGIVRGKKRSEAFHLMHQHRERNLLRPLERVIDNVFHSAIQFYRSSRGKGEEEFDVSSFFKIRGRHRVFDTFWRKPVNKRRKLVERKLAELDRNIQEFESR